MRCMKFLKGKKTLPESPITNRLLELHAGNHSSRQVCVKLGYCHAKPTRIQPKANGAPAFQSETSPSWSYTWEEPI